MSKPTVFLLLGLAVLVGLFFAVDPLGVLPDHRPAQDGAGDAADDALLGDGTSTRPGLATADGAIDPLTAASRDPEGEIDLGLGPVVVFGQVDQLDGGPLGGARVSVELLDAVASERGVRTRPDGKYRIRGLPEGVHTVVAAHKGFRASSLVTQPLAADTETELPTLVLEPRKDERTSVQVLVTDFEGRALPGAKILLTTMSWDMHLAAGPDVAGIPGVRFKAGTTDAEGRVVLNGVEPDEYDVVASATGYATESRDGVLVAAGTTRRIVFRLDNSVTIQGRLTGPENEGVRGMIMGLRMPTWASSLPAQSSADGSFVLDGLKPGDHMVVGYAEGQGQTMAPAKAPGTGLTLRLAGAGTVKGRVVDTEGEPVSMAHVRPFQSTYFSYWYSQIFPVGADGTFTLSLPKGDWELRVEADDGRVSEDTKVKVEIGETSEVEITMPPILVVRGIVVDADGRHVEGADVFVMQGGFPPTPSREFWARSDDEGRFEVAGLPAGSVGLHVDHPAYSKGTFEAVAAPREKAAVVRVVVTPGAILEGTVTDADGNPVVGQQVTAMPEGSYMESVATWTSADGRYRLAPLDAKRWSIGVGPLGAPSASESVNLVGGATNTVNLTLPATTGILTGLVRLGGAPAVGAEVVVSDARDIGSGRAVTDEEGRFRVEGLALGPVRVSATATGGARGNASVSIPKDPGTADVTIDIGTATFRARVVDGDGTPLSGVFSNLENPEATQGADARWRPLPQTGADGVILATGVAPGRWRLRASESAHANYLSQPFDIAEGGTVDLGTIVMRRAAEIRGRVTDDVGSVVESATASVKRPNGEPVFLFSTATTGSDGRFVLRGIEAGSYRLRVEALGHAPYEAPIEVPEEGVEANAVLPRGGGITFQVRSTDDEPIGSARLVLYDAAGQVVMRTLSIVNFTDSGVRYTGPDGTAVIDDLAAGGYRVAAERDGYEMDGPPVAVGVQSGERSPVRILLRKKAE